MLGFILTYDGNNPVLLRLQMRFMMWACDIIHRNAEFLGDADYLSRLVADLDYDPLMLSYLKLTIKLRDLYPPAEGPMKPENMPGYRGPRIRSTPPDAAVNITAISGLVNLI